MSFFPPQREVNTHSPAWVRNFGLFLLTTIFAYFLAKYVSLVFHEWSHALWANLLGVRSGSVLDIHYGQGWILNGGLPIVYSMSSLTDPSIFLLILELSVGLVLAVMVISRFRNIRLEMQGKGESQ